MQNQTKNQRDYKGCIINIIIYKIKFCYGSILFYVKIMRLFTNKVITRIEKVIQCVT